MSRLDVHQFMCRSDNFGVLIHDPDSGLTASIDAPEAGAVRRALADKGWRLSHILVTHHHADHTEGIAALKSETGCKVIGPKAEAAKIQGLDEVVAEGDSSSSARTASTSSIRRAIPPVTSASLFPIRRSPSSAIRYS